MARIKEADLKKLYYSIGEVAKMLDVNTSLIRFWEKEFSSINPKKNKKGNRLFTAKDILKLDAIYELVKERGFTLDGAKKALKSPRENVNEVSNSENSEIITRLETVKGKLLNLKIN